LFDENQNLVRQIEEMKNERAQIDQKYEGEKRGADEEI